MFVVDAIFMKFCRLVDSIAQMYNLVRLCAKSVWGFLRYWGPNRGKKIKVRRLGQVGCHIKGLSLDFWKFYFKLCSF